jgi:hypothetical protein
MTATYKYAALLALIDRAHDLAAGCGVVRRLHRV